MTRDTSWVILWRLPCQRRSMSGIGHSTVRASTQEQATSGISDGFQAEGGSLVVATTDLEERELLVERLQLLLHAVDEVVLLLLLLLELADGVLLLREDERACQ